MLIHAITPTFTYNELFNFDIQYSVPHIKLLIALTSSVRLPSWILEFYQILVICHYFGYDFKSQQHEGWWWGMTLNKQHFYPIEITLIGSDPLRTTTNKRSLCPNSVLIFPYSMEYFDYGNISYLSNAQYSNQINTLAKNEAHNVIITQVKQQCEKHNIAQFYRKLDNLSLDYNMICVKGPPLHQRWIDSQNVSLFLSFVFRNSKPFYRLCYNAQVFDLPVVNNYLFLVKLQNSEMK